VNGSFKAVGSAEKKGAEIRALTIAEIEANDPSYLKDLRSSGSDAEARTVYELNATKYSASPYFFLDSYNYFYTRRQDRDFADKIITENFGRFNGNPVVLKALAYLYQEHGRDEKARELYKEIFILRPSYSQSYYDMAMAYRDAGEIRKAASMFGRYQYLLQEGFLVGSDNFWLIQQHDSDNLFQKEGEKLGTDMRLVTRDDYVQNSTRMLFEWNDSEAEFVLQFANPQNRTFSWSHNLADNSSRIEDEKIAGYSMEEYVIDPSTPGPWQVNITYLGNKNLNPTYLKLTIWYNYGEKNQRKEVHTFKLRLKGTNQQLITLTNPGNLSD
jgi:tetratricopeptide (TPR) repeat protein